VSAPGVPLAWLLLVKHKGRFFAAIAGIAFAVILALVQLGFQNALFSSITRLYSSFNADLVLISPQYQSIVARETFPERRLYQATGVEEVESIAPIYMDTVEWTNPVNHYERFIFLVGFKPRAGVSNLPDVSSQLAQLEEPGAVLFDEASRSEFGPIGKLLRESGPVVTEISRRSVRVAGVFRMGASFANSGHLFTSDVNFLQLMPSRRQGDIDVGLIRLKSGSDAEAVRQKLVSILPEDVTVLTKQGFLDRETNFWSRSLPIGFLFRASLIMSLVVGAVVVYQILYSGISENLAEYATLKAIGYSHSRLFRVVLEEALILSVLGFIPGLLVSAGVYRAVAAVTVLPLQMTVLRMISAFVLTTIMCVVAGLLAMRRLYSADPAEIF
jgi:putative ABC transport system permease protein